MYDEQSRPRKNLVRLLYGKLKLLLCPAMYVSAVTLLKGSYLFIYLQSYKSLQNQAKGEQMVENIN